MDDESKPVRRVRRYVRRSQVDCHLYGVIDVDICFYCPLALRVEMDNGRPYIECQTPQLSPQTRTALQNYAIIQTAELPGHQVSQVCEAYGMSRTTFYRLKHQYDKEGLPGLVGLSQSIGPRRRRPIRMRTKGLTRMDRSY